MKGLPKFREDAEFNGYTVGFGLMALVCVAIIGVCDGNDCIWGTISSTISTGIFFTFTGISLICKGD